MQPFLTHPPPVQAGIVVALKITEEMCLILLKLNWRWKECNNVLIFFELEQNMWDKFTLDKKKSRLAQSASCATIFSFGEETRILIPTMQQIENMPTKAFK